MLGALYGGEDNVRQNKVYVFSEQVIFWENYDWGYDSFARNRGVRFVFFSLNESDDTLRGQVRSIRECTNTNFSANRRLGVRFVHVLGSA